MKELIKITTNDEGNRVVNARELHNALGSKKDFSNWMKRRIKQCDLIENQDYTSFAQMGERAIGGTVRKEYALTIEAAKEVAMMEGNEQGKKVRRYFIDVEKKYKEEEEKRLSQIPYYEYDLLQDSPYMGIPYLRVQTKQLADLSTKAQIYDEIISDDSLITTTQIAKDLGSSAESLNKLLADMKIQYRQNGQWLLYAKYQDKGYTKSKVYYHGVGVDNKPKFRLHTEWTHKGRMFIINKLLESGHINLKNYLFELM